MRAALFDRYGPPEVLYEGRAPVPVPGAGEVLVRVHAASVNGGDLWARSGALRLLMVGAPFPRMTGFDFAGEVAGFGPGGAAFAVGDRVWGALPAVSGARGRMGSAAEYVAVPSAKIGRAPASLDLLEAAALPAGTTALTALRDKVRLQRGERLLVRGANGGIGSVAVQLGAALGAHVTALTGACTMDLVHDLGAHVAYDHRTTKPTDLGRFDVVFDGVGLQPAAYRRLLNPGGRMVSITMRSPRAAIEILTSTVHRSARIRFFDGNPTTSLFDDLAQFVDDGALRPVVDTVHPLSDIAAAHRALAGRGVRGKHVIRVLLDARPEEDPP